MVFILFMTFLVLKLTDTVEWSWWWVMSPLWLSGIFGMAVLLMSAIG